jgi:hypothetical protein
MYRYLVPAAHIHYVLSSFKQGSISSDSSRRFFTKFKLLLIDDIVGATLFVPVKSLLPNIPLYLALVGVRCQRKGRLLAEKVDHSESALFITLMALRIVLVVNA